MRFHPAIAFLACLLLSARVSLPRNVEREESGRMAGGELR
jgi:hypothetical protein